jgi:hypothetical protein
MVPKYQWRPLLLLCLVVLLDSTQRAKGQKCSTADTPNGRATYVLASNTGNPMLDSAPTPTVLYQVLADGRLSPGTTVLGGAERPGSMHESPEGVYAIHDVGSYLLVEYPHEDPCCVIFIPKSHPLDFKEMKFDPNHLGAVAVDHGMTSSTDGATCDLWPLILTAPQADPNGNVAEATTTLSSACAKPGAQPYLQQDRWSQYGHPQLDGLLRDDEVWLLTSKQGKIVQTSLGVPDIDVADSPPFLTRLGSRGISLKAASDRYLVMSVRGEDGLEQNDAIYVRTARDGKWTRIAVDSGKSTYRMFDDWLVATPEGRSSNATAGEKTEAQRPMTLYNLADSRRITVVEPEADAEILQIDRNKDVLVRIANKLYDVGIEGKQLGNRCVLAEDSALRSVHWAFFSSN